LITVDAKPGDATASRLPFEEAQEEKEKGPDPDALTVALDPASYQPSPVWPLDEERV